MADLVLKGGNVVNAYSILKQDVVISGEKIVDLSDNYQGQTDCIDVSGKFILPGLIDAHVHFRQPGQEYKEDFESGSKAAIAGGVTTVFDMPNNQPPTTTLKALENKRKLVQGHSYCNYGFYFGVSKDSLAEISLVKNIAGIKVYMGSSTGNMLLDEKSALEEVFKSGHLIVVHAENEAIIRKNMVKYADLSGPEKHGLIRSPKAAFEAVKAALHLAKKCNTRLHIAHVSSELEIKEIAKFKSPLVSAEVSPHHLFLTEQDYFQQGHYMKVNPPLRTENDRLAMWKALKEGIIDIIATDHAPHLPSEKEQDYDQAPSGVTGVETLLPLLLDQVSRAELNLSDVVRLTSFKPAELFGLKSKGIIAPSYDADLVVVDMDLLKIVENSQLYTKCGWSPYHGRRLKGWPVMTMVNGVVSMRDGEIVSDPSGRELGNLKKNYDFYCKLHILAKKSFRPSRRIVGLDTASSAFTIFAKNV